MKESSLGLGWRIGVLGGVWIGYPAAKEYGIWRRSGLQ